MIEKIELPDKIELQQQAGEKLNELLSQYSGTPTLLLLSGGSAFSFLDQIEPSILTETITISVLDERLSSDPTINNYAQLTQTEFYLAAQQAGCMFIDTQISEGDTIDETAIDFEMNLQEWKMNHQEGVVIITQGIGADGHTAGILPFPEDPVLFEDLFQGEDTWVAGYEVAKAKSQHTLRITTTLTFLREQVNHSIVYVAGSEKQFALENALGVGEPLANTPAAIINEMQNVYLFTDQPIT